MLEAALTAATSAALIIAAAAPYIVRRRRLYNEEEMKEVRVLDLSVVDEMRSRGVAYSVDLGDSLMVVVILDKKDSAISAGSVVEESRNSEA